MHMFHLHVGEVTVTLQDIAMLFGLPLTDAPVGPVVVPVVWEEQVLHHFRACCSRGTKRMSSFARMHINGESSQVIAR